LVDNDTVRHRSRFVNHLVEDRERTLVLQHVGSFEGAAATADLAVVEGSGSGDLASATGAGDFTADPAARVRLDLTLQ
jgi:uncharacterized protein DUF3224